MRTLSKRICGLALACVLGVSLLPAAAFADDQTGEEESQETCYIIFIYDDFYLFNGAPETEAKPYPVGSTVDLTGLDTPQWEGHTFYGWYDTGEPTYRDQKLTSVTVEESTVLYARWDVQTLTLVYDPAWQFIGGENPDVTLAFSRGETVDLTTLSVPGHEDDASLPWYTSMGLAPSELVTAVTMDKDKTLYAGSTLGGSGDTLGGGAVPETHTLTLVYDPLWQYIGGDDPDVTLTYDAGTTVDLTALVIPGHESDTDTVWYSDSMLTTALTQVVMDGDLTLYAGSQRADTSTGYTLHYETNGGEEIPDDHFDTGGVYSLDKVPVREGYDFAGWYDDEDLTVLITAATMFRSKTIYAKWTPAETTDTTTDTTTSSHTSHSSRPAQSQQTPAQPEVPAEPDTPVQAENPFTDVTEGAYYSDAVAWAVEQGITEGTSDTTFAPAAGCTRGQIITFLWRACGSPEESGAAAFSDVAEGSFYQQAVLWAAQTALTTGTGNNTFSPDAICTRAQAVTFLWKAQGSPESSGSPSPFTDVSPDAYYSQAVSWAAQEGITTGTTATTFTPNQPCTRAQIVTLLYRAMG